MNCIICTTLLTGRQKKYCSRRCKSKNHMNAVYKNQQMKALVRKRDFIRRKGGGCEKCHYSRNLAALVFHHRDPTAKSFKLDSRNLGNRSMITLLEEFKKCDLLCANCHAEEHYPQWELSRN